MRRTFIATAAAAAMTFAVAGPAAAEKPGWAGPGLDTTTVETAVALSGTPFEFDDNGEDFDILVAAVVATGVNESILNGEDDYTVFAPTDDAFTGLVGSIAGAEVTEQEAFDALVDLLGVDGVTGVLAYHVTDNWRPSPSVVNPKKIEMLDGNTISARGGTIVANNSTAGFVQTDVKTADGGIHVIDSVLLP